MSSLLFHRPMLYYSVIRYVPNPIAEEFINIGALAFFDYGGNVKIRFLTDWRRVQDFSGEDITFLLEFAQRATKAAAEGFAVPGKNTLYNYYNVRGAAESWQNSIQYTEPRASLDYIDALMPDIIKTFLTQSA